MNPNLPIPPIIPSPFDTHIFILYICVSVSTSQIKSFIAFL